LLQFDHFDFFFLFKMPHHIFYFLFKKTKNKKPKKKKYAKVVEPPHRGWLATSFGGGLATPLGHVDGLATSRLAT
jgi:hypothetical protein